VDPWVKEMLRILGFDESSPEAAIFKDMDPGFKERIWDISGENRSPELMKQCAGWALGKAKNAREFVSYFQMYEAEVGQQAAAIKAKMDGDIKTLTDGGMDKVKANKQVSKAELGRELANIGNDTGKKEI